MGVKKIVTKAMEFSPEKQAEIDKAVASGEIKIYPKPREGISEELMVTSDNTNTQKKEKTVKNTKKEDKKAVSSINLGESIKVNSNNTGTLVLNSELIVNLNLKKGDEVIVDGNKRTISSVQLFPKKNQAQIATSGFGKWPMGEIEIQFNRS